MSILSQFFQSRHAKSSDKAQDTKNEAIASIFSTPFQTPKTKVIAKNKIIKKQQKLELQSQEIQQQLNEPQVTKHQVKNKKKKQSNKKKIQTQVQSQGKVSKKQKKKNNKQKQPSNKKQSNQADEKIQVEQKIEPQAEVKNQEPENLDSTVFVGNVPLQSTHKSIKKYFDKYGKVLKVWFRSIPVEQSKIPKKGLHIMKKYQQGADSMNAYVKFQKQQQAKAACAANGSDIEGKNIRVTLCNQFELDYQTTIFIGNLPRKVKDQQLWQAFKSVGTVKSVRVIRNKQTHEGIGIGYVRFSTQQEMKKAISQMNGKKIGDRPMRIKKAVSKQRLDKKVRKIKQKKQSKLKKQNPNKQITGKGTIVRQPITQKADFKNNNYPNKKNKPISKPDRFKHNQNNKPFNNQRKQRQERQTTAPPRQEVSIQIIRPKYGFQGKKKILQ